MTNEVVLQDIYLRFFNRTCSLNPKEWIYIESPLDRFKNMRNIIALGEKSNTYLRDNYEKFLMDLIYFIDALIRNDMLLSQTKLNLNLNYNLSLMKNKLKNNKDKILLDKIRHTKISKILSLSFASLINVYYKIIMIQNQENEKNFDPSKQNTKQSILVSGYASIIDSMKDRGYIGLSLRVLRYWIEIYFSTKENLSISTTDGAFFIFSQLMYLIFDRRENLHGISIKTYVTLIIRQIKNFKCDDFLALKNPNNSSISELKVYLYLLWRIILKRIDMIPLTINEGLIDYLKNLSVTKGPWQPTIDSILFILSKDRHYGSNVNYNKLKNYHEIKNHNIWSDNYDYKNAFITEIRYKYDESIHLDKYWDFKLPVFTKDCFELNYNDDE
eukprot:Mrub_03921.p1 GENE.Mrub_03921~~Mrub_03921.p1  ORF type:complete len:443 (-),score=44.39 Mrub_03921:36-1193(-)